VKRARGLIFAFVCAAALPANASAEWRPPDVHATKASLNGVLAAYAKASGTPDARFAQRRERWTYVNGDHRIAVRVAVRGEDFRATMALGNAQYAAGRLNALRWRADGNGIAHATLSDDQGDALDRLPQSVFPFDTADCGLAGESDRFGPAWVVVDRAPRDKPHWFYVDKSSGLIAHELTREGARTNVTAFDRFEPASGARRPRHWHVSNGNDAQDLDVTVDAVEPQAIGDADVALPPAQRTFAVPSPPPGGVVTLPAHFRGRTIFVDVTADGRKLDFILDTGTASIMLDSRVAARRGWAPVLEHATVPQMAVGPLALSNVSTLAIPLDIGYGPLDGILGYDFFVGNVVHVDYANQRVDVLTPQAAEKIFADPRTYVAPANFDEGIPLVHAAFGAASGDRFALDTGSPHLFVLAPFERRNAKEIAAHWTPASFRGGRIVSEERYLEGSIIVVPRRVASFTLGPQRFDDLTVGIEQSNSRHDAIDIPLDGIVGTDEMSAFDWWFDYDGGRIGLRRNNAR
jgi:hypothetical protein